MNLRDLYEKAAGRVVLARTYSGEIIERAAYIGEGLSKWRVVFPTQADAALIVALHNLAPEMMAVVETADRWRKRKGHGEDHDCDLCNALRAYREKEDCL